MTKDEAILQIRPALPQINLDLSSNSIEHFQNATLRPILKQQNDWLIHLFILQLDKQQASFAQASPLQQKQKIKDLLQRNQGFRQLLIGGITAWFTSSEGEIYRQDPKLHHRRIINMAIERLQSQSEKIGSGYL